MKLGGLDAPTLGYVCRPHRPRAGAGTAERVTASWSKGLHLAKMHHAIIRLVNSQAGHLLDVDGHGGSRDRTCVSRMDQPCRDSEDTTRLADRVVRSLDEYLAIRAAKIESSAAGPRRSVV